MEVSNPPDRKIERGRDFKPIELMPANTTWSSEKSTYVVISPNLLFEGCRLARAYNRLWTASIPFKLWKSLVSSSGLLWRSTSSPWVHTRCKLCIKRNVSKALALLQVVRCLKVWTVTTTKHPCLLLWNPITSVFMRKFLVVIHLFPTSYYSLQIVRVIINRRSHKKFEKPHWCSSWLSQVIDTRGSSAL